MERAFFSDNIDEVFSIIAKRTVYSYTELQEIMNKKTLVILFRFVALNKAITSQSLKDAGMKGYIQSIRQISDEQYIRIKDEN